MRHKLTYAHEYPRVCVCCTLSSSFRTHHLILLMTFVFFILISVEFLFLCIFPPCAIAMCYFIAHTHIHTPEHPSRSMNEQLNRVEAHTINVWIARFIWKFIATEDIYVGLLPDYVIYVSNSNLKFSTSALDGLFDKCSKINLLH